MMACLYGAMMLIGATLGGDDPLRPLPQGTVGRSAAGGLLAAQRDDELQFRDIETVAALDAALDEARTASRPVMLDFTADWCISCKEMEEYTFPEPGVIGALEPFMLLRADVTENNDNDQALLQRFRSFGPPTIAFFDAYGIERENYKLVGFVPPEKFRDHVRKLAAL
jgi:thiol:disulfide interchange protein DsbD